MSLEVQFLTLGAMFGSGAGLGVLYDIYRVAAGQLKISRWLLPILDILYWIVATILVFRVLYTSNQGQVRLFVFIGLLVGICFYFGLLSHWVVKLLLFVIRLGKALIRLLIRTVQWVVVKPAIGIYRLLIITLGFLAAFAVFLFKIVLQLLYPFRFLFRPLLRLVRRHVKLPAGLKRLGNALMNGLKRIWKWF